MGHRSEEKNRKKWSQATGLGWRSGGRKWGHSRGQSIDEVQGHQDMADIMASENGASLPWPLLPLHFYFLIIWISAQLWPPPRSLPWPPESLSPIKKWLQHQLLLLWYTCQNRTLIIIYVMTWLMPLSPIHTHTHTPRPSNLPDHKLHRAEAMLIYFLPILPPVLWSVPSHSRYSINTCWMGE